MGNIGCGAKCAKLTILLINTLFMLIGLFLLGFGIFLVIDAKLLHQTYFVPVGGSAEQMIGAAAVILIVGIVIVFITIIGCCATAKQHVGCLTFYSGVLILLLILQIAAVIVVAVFYNKIIDGAGRAMQDMVSNDYGREGKNETTKMIDEIQSEFYCCGVTSKGPEDWKLSYYYNKTGQNVPDSCCTRNGSALVSRDQCLSLAYKPEDPKRSTYIYIDGCDHKLDSLIRYYVGILIGVVVGVIVIQIAFIVITCILKSSLARGYEYV